MARLAAVPSDSPDRREAQMDEHRQYGAVVEFKWDLEM